MELSKDGIGKTELRKEKFLLHFTRFSLEDNLRSVDHWKEESTAIVALLDGARGPFHMATKIQVCLLFEQSLISYSLVSCQ